MYVSLRSIEEKEANVLIWNNITNCLAKWKNGFFFFFKQRQVILQEEIPFNNKYCEHLLSAYSTPDMH